MRSAMRATRARYPCARGSGRLASCVSKRLASAVSGLRTFDIAMVLERCHLRDHDRRGEQVGPRETHHLLEHSSRGCSKHWLATVGRAGPDPASAGAYFSACGVRAERCKITGLQRKDLVRRTLNELPDARYKPAWTGTVSFCVR